MYHILRTPVTPARQFAPAKDVLVKKRMFEWAAEARRLVSTIDRWSIVVHRRTASGVLPWQVFWQLILQSARHSPKFLIPHHRSKIGDRFGRWSFLSL